MKKPAKKKTDKKPKAPFRLEMVRAGDLKDNPSNWRRHPAGQVSALKNLIHDPAIGWAGAFLFNERTGHLIDGHARKGIVGPDEFVPVLIGSWTPEAEKKILATLDPSSRMAEADADALRTLLKDVSLDGEDFADLAGTLDELLESAGGSEAKEGKTDPDAVPEAPKKATSERGEVYILGQHRLMCGDSTKKEEMQKLMAGKRALLCFTSPPYADIRIYKSNSNLSPSHLSLFILAAKESADFFCINLGLKREDGIILPYWEFYMAQAANCGLKLISWNVWDKGRGGSVGAMTAMFPLEHEWLLVFGESSRDIIPTIPNLTAGQKTSCRIMNKNGEYGPKQEYQKRNFGELGSVIRLRMVNENRDHPAQFPVELPFEYIRAFGADVVLDPFLGSGTTIIAAEQLGRRCFGMEISPRYVDVARRRWAEFIHGEGCDWQALTPAERI